MIDLFYSQNCSRIYNLDKKLLSTNYDPICYHTLPIPDIETPDVYNCFDLFTSMELMEDEDNLYYDEKKKRIYKKL